MTTVVMTFSCQQLQSTSLIGWQGGQNCLVVFTRVLILRGQSLSHCGLLQSGLYQVPSLHLQDMLRRAMTKFVSVCSMGADVLSVVTASQVQDLVEGLTVGHECPLFSRQHSGVLGHVHPTRRHPCQNAEANLRGASETSSFPATPRLTTSRPPPHEETSCI